MREAVALAQGMEVKHSTFNTGFAGAKIVCDVGPDADPSKINKDALLNAARDMLDDFQGGMFTGCDLNVSLTDMERLASADEYNSLGNTVDSQYISINQTIYPLKLVQVTHQCVSILHNNCLQMPQVTIDEVQARRSIANDDARPVCCSAPSLQRAFRWQH